MAAVGGVILALAMLAIVPRTREVGSPRAAVPDLTARRPEPPPSNPAAHLAGDAAPQAGLFSGRVLSWTTGAAISGAQVTFAGDNRTTLSTHTDATGGFTLQPPVPGRYVLTSASATGFLAFAPGGGRAIAVLTKRDVPMSGITLFLRPATDYTGVVEDTAGARVAGASVRLLDANQGDQAMAQLADTFVSDASGEFQFHAPDDTILEARHPTSGSGRAQLDRSAQLTGRVVLRLIAAPDGTPVLASISGRVVDASGAPVTTPRVRAASVDGFGMHPRGETRGDASGRFQIDGLDPGKYVVWVVCEGCASSRIRAKTGSEITLTVGLGGSVVGRVIETASGEPVAAFVVKVARTSGRRENVLEERSVIDSDGRFEIDGLPTGEYQVRAAARDHVPSPPVDVRVSEDAIPEDVVLRLVRGGTVHGTVSDRTTRVPLAGAEVTVERSAEAGWSVMSSAVGAITAGDGSFTLNGVSPGLRSIRALATGHHAAMVSGLLVESGARIGPVDLQLTPTRSNERPGLELSGIGARVTAIVDALALSEVSPDGGADRAGLVVGDVILEIDDQPTSGLSVANALERLRGPEGTRVRLFVRSAGRAPVREVTVERRVRHY